MDRFDHLYHIWLVVSILIYLFFDHIWSILVGFVEQIFSFYRPMLISFDHIKLKVVVLLFFWSIRFSLFSFFLVNLGQVRLILSDFNALYNFMDLIVSQFLSFLKIFGYDYFCSVLVIQIDPSGRFWSFLKVFEGCFWLILMNFGYIWLLLIIFYQSLI